MTWNRAIPACTLPKAPKTTGTTSVRQCHMRLISTRKSLYFANFSACFLPMLPSAGQLISIRDKCLSYFILFLLFLLFFIIFIILYYFYVSLCPSIMGKWGLYPIWAPTNPAGEPSGYMCPCSPYGDQ